MINYRDFPWVMEKMLYREHVCLHSLEDLPADAATDRESFLKLGIKSFVAIPHFIGGYPVAGLMFDSRREEIKCHEDFVTQLKLIGEIVTGAFYRMKMEERYRKNFIGIRLANGRIREEEFPLTELTKSEFQYEGIIGDSEAMRLVFSKMEQVAPTDSTVLILGETGTGKGVLARAIYELSNRNKKRIVTVNCAALTPNLIESELFGREKGAYTGSTEMQIGRFELADGGTLVLDEFTELPLDLQAKLLRAIQDGEFERLGSPRTLRVNVRIIALTSRNLKEEVSQGRFRQDLYYRLNVFPITMPPLRERISDIPLLVEHFVEQFNRRMQKDINNIPKTVMAELMKYSWPGNVRELEHVIERSMIVTRGSSLQLAEKLDESGSGMVEEDLVTDLAEIEKYTSLKFSTERAGELRDRRALLFFLDCTPTRFGEGCRN